MYPKKKVLSLVKMRSRLRRFHKKDFFTHLYFEYSHPGVLISIAPFFHGCKHPLFPCVFHYKRTFFQGLFCIKSYWKSPKKVDRTLNPETFNKRTFFHGTFSVRNIRTFFLKLFSKNFFGGYRKFDPDRFSRIQDAIKQSKYIHI